MTALATLLWILNLACDTGGHLSFKAAAIAGGNQQGITRWKTMAGNVWIWVGLAIFVSEFFLWLAFVSMVPLSVAILLGACDIATVSVGGWFFFGEALTLRRVIPTALIAIGVVLVGWG